VPLTLRTSRLWVWMPLLAGMLGVFAIYERTRPHLRPSSHGPGSGGSARLAELFGDAQSGRYMGDSRAAVAALREILSDISGGHEPRVRLELAQALLARQHDADFSQVADELERAAIRLLARLGPTHQPTRRDFEQEGFHLGGGYRPEWPPPFLTTDVDRDGRSDLLVAPPGDWQPSVCFLFCHTGRGWVSYRLGLGVPVIGVWAFDISRRGPRTIAIASLPDSEYAPNLFLDLFVWQRGRMTSVLSVKIENGWQWEHRDTDGDGLEEIRLYGGETRPNWRYPAAQVVTTYRWNGSRFVPGQTTRVAASSSPRGWLETGRQLFLDGRYREAARVLELAAWWRPHGKDDPSADFDESGERQQTWYFLGLCRALLGHHAAARQAMKAAVQAGSGDQRDQEVVAYLAREFLASAARPRDLPVALAGAGQLFRALEVAQSTLPATTDLDRLLAAVGIRPDTAEEVDLTGDGKPERLARFHWRGGSAVVAWERRTPRRGRLWLLAYALAQRPPDFIPLTWPEWFYLPQPLPLEIHPVPKEVGIARVERGALPPRVVVRYRQGFQGREAGVVWQGDHFVATDPPATGDAGLTQELDRIEASLFEQGAYRQTLDALRDFERRVRDSRLTPDDKSDLLREVYYHQAVCFRKLGATRRAAVVLTAIWRTQPGSAWGQLARRSLRFPLPVAAN
jgi:hypothetical protein